MKTIMQKYDLEKYNNAQLEEMFKYKWIESEKYNRDLGEQAFCEWIHKFAKQFREEWDNNFKGAN